jgi:hypothetical protein
MPSCRIKIFSRMVSNVKGTGGGSRLTDSGLPLPGNRKVSLTLKTAIAVEKNTGRQKQDQLIDLC